MSDYQIENCVPTSTGNELGYYAMTLHSPQWSLPIGPEALEDLQHAEALEYDREHFPNVHIHWSEESRDCDGGHGDYGIHRPNADEFNDDGSVNIYEFWRNEVRFALSAHAYAGVLKIECDRDNDFDRWAEWSETTDEGFRHREIRLCPDECERPTNTVYDQYAQEAGY